jgi:hypothetical protein
MSHPTPSRTGRPERRNLKAAQLQSMCYRVVSCLIKQLNPCELNKSRSRMIEDLVDREVDFDFCSLDYTIWKILLCSENRDKGPKKIY